MYKHKVGPIPDHLTRTLEERFWQKVNQHGPTPEHNPELGPCWLWTGSRNPNGYGLIGVGSKLAKAHRVSYEIHHGPIPSGLWILHKCDNPPCVNPPHLYAGTRADNARDAVERNLLKTPHPRGVDQWQAKLTEEKVREIRRRCTKRSPQNKVVAAEMGITMYTIGDILRGKTWRHVT